MASTMTGWRLPARRGRGSAMANRSPQAGGFIIAVAILAGTIIGGLKGQPSIGLLAGLGLGVAAALAVWLVDRRK
jgi:sugar phosphate permease